MASNKKNKSMGFNTSGSNSRYGFKTVPNESVLWKLQSADGTDFGDVSYGAYKAVESGKLDSYKPKNDTEKEAISKFRSYLGTPLSSPSGVDFGKVSYDAYQAITNDKLDSYTPKNDTEKKTLEDFKNYATVYSADTVSGGLKYNSEIGQFGKGNIDLYNRPQHKNDDGTVSTVRSATFEIDGKYVVLPTVVYDGKSGRETSKILSDEEAVEHYKQTGQYLGKFDTLYEADIYAQKLHLAQDFYYGSKYKTTKNGKETEFSVWTPGLVIESGYDDLTYDVINKNEDAKSIQTANDIAINATIAGVDKGFLQTMTDDEVAVFNYIYSTQGADKAYEFINDISADLNYRQRVKTEKMWADEAAKAPVKMSAFSVLISPLKMASYVGQVADYVDDGSIDQNAGYNKYVHIPNAIRNEVSTQIENSGNWGTVGSYAYNIGMSMADSLYNTAISGGQQWLSLAIMGTGAAADTTVAAKDRGLSDTQAFWLGTISGAGEIISEKMSFDAIMDADLFTQSARKYFVRSATVGGLEEVVADGINFAADTIIAGDKSLWSQSIKSYMQQGKTKSEAVGLTLGNKLLETALSFAGGAFSTGVMSLGGTVYNTSRIRDVGKQYNNSDDISKVIEAGLKQPTDSATYQNAVRLQEKMKSGTLTDFEIGQQVLLNEGATVSDETEVAETKVSRAKKLIDKFSSYIHKSDATTTDTAVETATPITDETAPAVETTTPTADTSTTPVAVGDTFKDTKTGNTITVVERNAESTTVEIDTGAKTETREFTNSHADSLVTNEQFERMESSETISPEEAQRYNIVVSNLKRKAEELGLLDTNFFTALQNVNLYNPSANDRALISSEFRRVFAGNTDPLVAGWLDAIGVDAQPVTSINEQNMPVSTEKTPKNKANIQMLENYSDAVDDIMIVSDEAAKKFAENRVAVEVLGNTPDVILENVDDARDLKVIISYNKLYLAVRKDGVFKGHYHNLGTEMAKKLPDFLKSPDAIVQLSNGRLNLFATVETDRGNNGIISVELNSTKDIGGKNEDYNVVVTMFSSDDSYAQNLLSGDGVTVKYKREDLSQVNPQLYKWLATINDKSSVNDNISQKNNIVNNSIYTNAENMPVSSENTPVNEDVTNIDVDMAEGEILSLKHTKNVYSLFKGAMRIVVGKDIITDGFVVLPLTDESLAGVKKVIGDSAPIQENPNFEMSKFYHADNDVIIQGNPKLGEAPANNKTINAYTFKIGDAFYSCQQKFIDAFNNGKNVIKASKSNNIPWTVHNENGDLVALFLGLRANVTEQSYNQMQSVAEIKVAEQQKKAENADKPFNQNEVRQIFDAGRPFFSTAHGVNYVGEGHIFVACDENAAEFIKNEYRKQNANSNYEIEHKDGFGGMVEKMLSEAKELAEAKDPISYSGASPNNRADNAYLMGDYAIVFNKNYANIIKKRSKDMKIISNGSMSSTILVGYDADGNITGFALPILAKGNVTTKDGKSVPFVGEVDIKRLVKEAAANETKSDKSVIETPESVTEPTESVIKKANSVTETPENEKITVDMDDETRAELLNKKSVNVVSVDAENTKTLDNVDLDALQNSYPSYARPIIKKIARDFGILKEPFFNPDIELEFSYSGDSIQESINKQHSRYGDFVKMLSVFSDVIENAVGVETHKDKYTGTRREDTNLKQMYVLASAFSDEKGVYPVKLEVKEFKKNTNKLYLSVVLTKKESRYLSGNLGQDQLNTAPPTSTISISDLVGIVNPSEGDFLKYFPDSMLDSEQIESKNKALAKDAEKIEKFSEEKKRNLATVENANGDVSLPEAFKRDENGKIRFNQVDIDYTNKQYREETFNTLKQGGIDTETQKRGIVGKYGIHKKSNGYFGVNLLSSGMDIAAFESFEDALKFATYTNDNVSFNDVSYTRNAEGRLTIEATPEFMQYGEQIRAIKNEKAYLKTEITNIFTKEVKSDIIEENKTDVNASFSLEEDVEQTGVITKADVEAIQSIGRKSVNDFTGEDLEKTKNFAERYFRELGEKSPFFRAWFGDWRENDRTPVHVVAEKGNARGVIKNKDTGWDVQVSGKVFNETKAHKMQNNILAVPYLEYINSIVENAVLLDSYSIGEKKSNNSAMMHSLYAIADIGNGRELVKLYVEELNDVNSDGTIKRSYQLQNITNQQLSVKGSSNALASSFSTADRYSVSDLFKFVKANDKNFNPKPASKVVNEDGTPMAVYHGTNDAFTEFKYSELRDREGSFFFAQNYEDAAAYTGTGNVMSVYVNLQNPIDYNNMPSEINRLPDKRAQVEALKKIGYDGWMADMEDGWGEISAFYPEQIKSATDNIGTFNKSNPDIRYSVENEKGVLGSEKRNNVTARSVGRSVSESTDKSGRSFYETTGRAEENGGQRTDTESSRRIYAENVRNVQGTEIRQQGAFRCEFIKPDYYTDDMRVIKENNAKQGLKTYFFFDSGEVVFKSSVKFRGAVTKNGDVYIQCNHAKYSPEQINKHELVHRNYNTEDMKKVREYINDNLTEDEKRHIVNVMYARYALVCKGDVNKIFEEFVCDVLSGINSYGGKFADISQKYWSEHTDLIDSYSAADYSNSIDAGGVSLSSQEYADTFYSKMAKEIDGIKQDKIGAFSVVNYLKGRGVKDEEIKWSGIEEWLSDKKSVTKAELQEFAKNNMLQIDIETIEDDITIRHTQNELDELATISNALDSAWEEANNIWREAYGTTIPVEILGSDDAVSAMTRYVIDQHGGIRNFEGITYLSGAERKIYDDYSTNSITRKIKDLEEKQADIVDKAKARRDNTKQTKHHKYTLEGGSGNYRELLFKIPKSDYTNNAMTLHWDGRTGVVAHARVQDFVDADGNKVLFVEEIQSDWHNEGAKQGYVDSKDETTLINRKSELTRYLQSRLGKNNNADEMAKIESARAEVVSINQQLRDNGQYKAPDAPFRSTYHEFVLKNLLRMAAEQGYDTIGWTTGKTQEERWSSDYAEAYRIEYDQEIPKFLNKYGKKWGAKVGKTEIGKVDGGWYEVEGTTIWTMPITDAMRESVLYEGQPMYSIEKVNGTNKLYVKADRQVVAGATPKEWGASVEKYINDSIRQGKDVQLVAADGDILTITADTAGKAKFRNYVTRPDGTSTVMNDAEYRTKLNAESHIDELSATSKRGKKDVPDYKNHAFAKDGFNYRTAYFEDFDGQYYKVTLSVGKNGEINTVYNVGKIKEAPFPLVAQRPGTESTGGHKASTNSISDKSQNVNTEDISFSLDEDGEFDLFDLWEQKNKEFRTIKKGENPTRDIDVPKKITKDKLVSQFARTMLEAGVTPDTAVSEFEKRVLDGTMTHEVITNNSAREWAVNQIKYHGFEEALNTWGVYTRDGNVGKKELALGMELYNQCITSGDVTNAMKIAAELVAEATHAGQTLQATRMLKLMTPDGQLYYLEKSIQKMNDEFKKKIGDKYENIELNEELMEKFLTEKEADKRDEIYDDICQDIADQIPPTLLDKWNSWRYLAMLGNPRTHIRNIAGNAVFTPAIKLKNYIGAVIEKVAKVDTDKRTKSLYKSKKAVEFAKKDFAKMLKVLQGENAKYAVTSDIEGKRTIFKTKWLEKLRTKNFEWLEKEDMWFLKMHYVDALAQIITARKLDIDSIDEKTLDIARAYAVREAQRATYRDANSIAEALNKLQKKASHSDKKAVRAANVLLEGVMPFKKTPLNIAKQGVQYSPVGILTGVYKTVSKIKDGDAYSTTDIIDDFAKGLTGTALMLLGTLLASLGIISGGDDENKKKKEFDKMVGEQSFSINIGDKSYTIDWMAPTCLPLFTGVELYELTKDDFKFADITAALSSLTDPLLELSVFSGISGAIESAQYNDTNTLFAIGSDMTTSYITQALPTVGGQISRIVDKNKREYYYTDKNSNLPKGVQNFIGQVSSKIPFASYLFEPSIDEWGREETYGGILERTLENVVSPGYYSEKNYTEVDEEIKRLYESTGDADVLPVIQQKKYTESKIDYPMTATQYTETKKLRGQKSFELIEQLLSNRMSVKLQNKQTGKYQKMTYSMMSDEEKVRAIKKCYEQAGDETKEIMLDEVKGNR